MAPSTTLGRVRELEQNGVITGYHAAVDLAKMGRPLQALVFVKLRPKTSTSVSEFVDRVWALDSTVSVHLISGSEDALVHLAVADTDELRDTVLRNISNLPGVADERTSIVFDHRSKHVIPPADGHTDQYD